MINKKNIGNLFGSSTIQALLIFWVFMQISPIIWQIITSFKTTREIIVDLFAFPESFYLGNYDFSHFAEIGVKMGAYFRNSLLITLFTLALLITVSYLAAYVIAKFKFKGKNIVLFILIILVGVPIHSLVVPLYYLIAKMGLLNRNRYEMWEKKNDARWRWLIARLDRVA